MPILKTSGIKTGELRLFEVQRPKIKPRYKIICHFQGIRRIFKIKNINKCNNYKQLKKYPGMFIAKILDG
jgi:hypothetical protein